MRELELTGEHVARLNDTDLRSLVVKLSEAESRRTGKPMSAILGGGNQTAPDGGVDVRIRPDDNTDPAGAASGERGSALPLPQGGLPDFIPRANTGFQVKCEDMPPKAIADEMRPKGVLRDSIKHLIASKGAYVIVCSKGTVADAALSKRLQAMRDAVADQPGHLDLKLDFYDRDRIARWVREYTGIEMWLRERVDARLQGWQGYGPWAGADVPYLLDETARLVERTGGGAPKALSIAEGLGLLRGTLRQPGQVVRLVGLSGTGKTRLVQSLFEKDVGIGEPLDAASVLYTDLGNEPEPSAREMLLRLGDLEQRAVVVVDNCNPQTHRNLAAIVGQYKKVLSLITVEYDVAEDDAPDATDVYELAPASEQVLDGILRRLVPHLAAPDRQRITEFSGGNARIALALARTVEKGETLGVLNDAELFRRLFRQGQADDPELLKAAQVCSLVYSFQGVDTRSDESELRVLAALAEMTPNELYGHVGTLKRRDLVQSRSRWRAVLPPALANRLAKRALQEIPPADITEAFAVSERLLISFSRRLENLHHSEEACAVARRWIEDENWLADPGRLNELGRRLFMNLAPLVPDLVLAALERALRPENAAAFLAKHQHSLYEWCALLRHLAYQPAVFERAAGVLLAIAALDDGPNLESKNAWKEMFRIALSGTVAPPVQRVRLLEQLLATSTGKRLELTWVAIEAMLEANHISSSHDFSFGARPQGYGWKPDSQDDVVAWFDSAFALLRRVAASGAEGLQYARDCLAAHFREVWACGVETELSALMMELAGPNGWPAGWVATRSTLRFDSDGMSPPEVLMLKELDAAMAPKGLAQEIRAYALGHAQGLLDVVDALDESDEAEDSKSVGSWERVNVRVGELGAALAEDDAALVQLLPELLAEGSGRQEYVGEGLGRATTEAPRHWKVLRDAFMQAPDEANIALLAGFVQGVRKKDPEAGAAILDSVVADPKLDIHYPVLLGWAVDDKDGDRLLASMKRARAAPRRFLLRTNSGPHGGLSVPKFCEAVEMLSQMENGLLPAIDELATELHRLRNAKPDVPDAIAPLARSLLVRFDFGARTHNVAWRVNELAKFALAGPAAVDSAAAFAARLSSALEDYGTRGEEYGDVACTLFRLQPIVAFDAFLGKPNPKRHLGFRARFVARHGPVVQCAPEEVILQWVSAAPEPRAAAVAREIDILDRSPKALSSSAQAAMDVALSPMAARLLEMAPDKTAVLQAFERHLHPTHWSGSLAHTLTPHLRLVEGLTTHADPAVAMWAQTILLALNQRIERERSVDVVSEQSFE